MATKVAKTMLPQMKLTDEAVGIIVGNDGHGLTTIDDFSFKWEKSSIVFSP